MDHNKNLLIIQCYNANKGDNSVLSTMLSTIEPLGCNIKISAYDPDKAIKEYNIMAFEYLFSFKDAKLASNKLKRIFYLLKELLWLFYSLFLLICIRIKCPIIVPKNKKGLIKAYMDADLIVLPGGHFFTSFNSLINNFSHYYALRFAQIIGKKTMVYSETVGPYKGLSGFIERILANRCLKRCNVVTLRERDSLKSYHEKNARLTAETVFLKPVHVHPLQLLTYTNNDQVSFVVGMTVHHIYYKHYFEKGVYVKIMSDIINAILDKYPCYVLIIPMEDKYNSGGDRPIIKEIIDKVQDKKRVGYVDIDLNSEETANLIGQVDIFVGTKTHSIVYGLKTATPTLSISYQQKSNEFMKLFDMEKYSIDMKNLNVVDFMEKFDKLYINREKVVNHLKDKYPDVKLMSEENNRILAGLLYD
jgi:colanic acid/amylovoran biosynthesis protein